MRHGSMKSAVGLLIERPISPTNFLIGSRQMARCQSIQTAGAIRLFRCNICGPWRSSGENRTTTRKPRFMRARWSIPIGCLSGHVTCGPFRIFRGLRRFGVMVRTMRAGIGCRTVFLRGQRGTDGAIPDVWPVGSVLVVLDTSAVQLPISPVQRDFACVYRVGSVSKAVDHPACRTLEHAAKGVGLRPYQLAHLSWARTGAGDVAVSWNGNRALTAILGI